MIIEITGNVYKRTSEITDNCTREGFVCDKTIIKKYDKQYNKRVYYELDFAPQDEVLYKLKYGYDE